MSSNILTIKERRWLVRLEKNDINQEYLEWMAELVKGCAEFPITRWNEYDYECYSQLFKHLNSIDFYYDIPMDANRYEDGIELRYRFGREMNYDDRIIANCLDDHPCSVLEMMVALAVRCEEHIIYDDEVENQAGLLFWDMLDNLDLVSMRNGHYRPWYVDMVITKFLEHDYESDGTGGLFTIKDCDDDLRNVEIWYQMCRYIDVIYRKEE